MNCKPQSLNHLITNSLLPNMQFGFRPLSSTQEALMSATTNWHEYLLLILFPIQASSQLSLRLEFLNLISSLGLLITYPTGSNVWSSCMHDILTWLTLSRNLSWATHTDSVWAEAVTLVSFIEIPVLCTIKAQLYKSLVLSTLDYCLSFGIYACYVS